ncbi:MAG TPA: DoxX family protein [Nocardioidaceae bacterium]|nr:DoxX family protein [Nocardioidaceae bacterium]
MTLTYILGAILVLVFAALGGAKVAAVPSMRARAAHVGFSIAAYRGIGALELLAAVGILAGVYDERLAAAAAVGLVLLLAGAVTTHARTGDGLAEVAPGLVLSAVAAVFVALILAGQS